MTMLLVFAVLAATVYIFIRTLHPKNSDELFASDSVPEDSNAGPKLGQRVRVSVSNGRHTDVARTYMKGRWTYYTLQGELLNDELFDLVVLAILNDEIHFDSFGEYQGAVDDLYYLNSEDILVNSSGGQFRESSPIVVDDIINVDVTVEPIIDQ